MVAGFGFHQFSLNSYFCSNESFVGSPLCGCEASYLKLFGNDGFPILACGFDGVFQIDGIEELAFVGFVGEKPLKPVNSSNIFINRGIFFCLCFPSYWGEKYCE